jgi:hypothetical protein
LLYVRACRDVDGLKSLTVSDIQDAPVGLAELAQMLIVVEVPSGSVSGGTTPAFLTPSLAALCRPRTRRSRRECPTRPSRRSTRPATGTPSRPPTPSCGHVASLPHLLHLHLPSHLCVVRFAFPVRYCGVFGSISIVCRSLSS